MFDADSPLRVRVLDSHREPLEEAGVIPGRAGKMSPAWSESVHEES